MRSAMAAAFASFSTITGRPSASANQRSGATSSQIGSSDPLSWMPVAPNGPGMTIPAPRTRSAGAPEVGEHRGVKRAHRPRHAAPVGRGDGAAFGGEPRRRRG
jgi:hypothetical protein